MNIFVGAGRLASDPEVKYTQSGKAVCQFRLAIDDGYGENKKTNFIPIVVWGKQAESCANCLTKGQNAIIEGRIQVRQYEAKDGTKRTATEVVSRHVEFGAKPRGAQQEEQQGTQQPEQQGWDFRGTPVPDEDIPF